MGTFMRLQTGSGFGVESGTSGCVSRLDWAGIWPRIRFPGMPGVCSVSVVGSDSGPLGSGSHSVLGLCSECESYSGEGVGLGCHFGSSVVSPDTGFSGFDTSKKHK